MYASLEGEMAETRYIQDRSTVGAGYNIHDRICLTTSRCLAYIGFDSAHPLALTSAATSHQLAISFGTRNLPCLVLMARLT